MADYEMCSSSELPKSLAAMLTTREQLEGQDKHEEAQEKLDAAQKLFAECIPNRAQKASNDIAAAGHSDLIPKDLSDRLQEDFLKKHKVDKDVAKADHDDGPEAGPLIKMMHQAIKLQDFAALKLDDDVKVQLKTTAPTGLIEEDSFSRIRPQLK